MKIAKFMMAVAALMMSTACCGNTGSPRQTGAGLAPGAKEEAQAQAVKKDGKALVVFFSHAGDNYSVGNIEVGNTKIVADYISEFLNQRAQSDARINSAESSQKSTEGQLTGADQFEIVTHKYDGMAYKPLCDLAKEEQQKGELPPFEGEPGDLSQYDTVFIGGPVWWGTYPQVMFTFFKKYDLNGKTIIPFTTHEGYGLGSCVKDVKKAYPNANVTGEFSMYGHDVRSGKERVEKWLKEIGF